MTTTTYIPYSKHDVWDDDSGETYYIAGHLPKWRAISAVNCYLREVLGRTARDRVYGAVKAADVQVGYGWLRPDPQSPDDDETAAWCDKHHPEAEAVTVVRP
jgi:hypothetical protein